MYKVIGQVHSMFVTPFGWKVIETLLDYLPPFT
jgi:hypothetical protein